MNAIEVKQTNKSLFDTINAYFGNRPYPMETWYLKGKRKLRNYLWNEEFVGGTVSKLIPSRFDGFFLSFR